MSPWCCTWPRWKKPWQGSHAVNWSWCGSHSALLVRGKAYGACFCFSLSDYPKGVPTCTPGLSPLPTLASHWFFSGLTPDLLDEHLLIPNSTEPMGTSGHPTNLLTSFLNINLQEVDTAKTTSTWQGEAPALPWQVLAHWSPDSAEGCTMGDLGRTERRCQGSQEHPPFFRILRLFVLHRGTCFGCAFVLQNTRPRAKENSTFTHPEGLSIMNKWFTAHHMKTWTFSSESLRKIKGKVKLMDQRELGQQTEQRHSLSKSMFKHFI